MFFDNLGLGHFEFKMVDILTQNIKSSLLVTITMQYKIKTTETVATRDSRKCGRWTDGHRYDNTPLDDRGCRGGKNNTWLIFFIYYR